MDVRITIPARINVLWNVKWSLKSIVNGVRNTLSTRRAGSSSWFMDSKESLINSLKRLGYLKTPSLVDAFEAVDRTDFVPKNLEREAYIDHALPIGEGQTISQPLTVAFTLELLSPKQGEKILEIGAGSGWQAALLAHVVGAKGKVVTLERIPRLVEMARRNVGKYKDFADRVEVLLADGSKGYGKEAPYDRIVAAASARNIPEMWKKQLKVGGIIVAPVGDSIFKLVKEGENNFREEEYPGFVFVPLVEES